MACSTFSRWIIQRCPGSRAPLPEGCVGAARHCSQCPMTPRGLCRTPGIQGGWDTLSLPDTGPSIPLEVWDEQQPEGFPSLWDLWALLSHGSVGRLGPCSRAASPALLLHWSLEMAGEGAVPGRAGWHSVTATSRLHSAQDAALGVTRSLFGFCGGPPSLFTLNDSRCSPKGPRAAGQCWWPAPESSGNPCCPIPG